MADIATKAELLQRLRERASPQQKQSLTPKGWIAEKVQKDHLSEDQSRIARLRAALNDAHQGLETQHSFSRLSGYAAAHFAKER